MVEEYNGPNHPFSPSNSLLFPRRAHSAAERQDRSQIPRKPIRPPKIRETEQHRHRSPSIEYSYVEAHSKQRDVEYEEAVYPRKIPIHFVDEVKYDRPVTVSRGYHREHEEDIHPRKVPVHFVQEVVYEKPVAGPRESYGEQQDRSHTRSQEYTVEEAETVSRGAPSQLGFDDRSIWAWEQSHRGYDFNDHGSNDSGRSSEARHRRRRERARPTMPPWEAPHIIHPEQEDEVVVVTERYEYRRPSRQQVDDESDRRRQEYVDRIALNSRDPSQGFSPEDAARYFQDDWARSEPEPQPPVMMQQRRPTYRNQRPQQSSLSGSERSYEYTIRGKGLFEY